LREEKRVSICPKDLKRLCVLQQIVAEKTGGGGKKDLISLF